MSYYAHNNMLCEHTSEARRDLALESPQIRAKRLEVFNEWCTHSKSEDSHIIHSEPASLTKLRELSVRGRIHPLHQDSGLWHHNIYNIILYYAYTCMHRDLQNISEFSWKSEPVLFRRLFLCLTPSRCFYETIRHKCWSHDTTATFASTAMLEMMGS